MPNTKILGYQIYFMKKDFFEGKSLKELSSKYLITSERCRQILNNELGTSKYKKVMELKSKQRKKMREEKRKMRYKTDIQYRKHIIKKAKEYYANHKTMVN